MADQYDQLQQNSLEAPPEFSMDPPDFSVLRLDSHSSPCANCGFSATTTTTTTTTATNGGNSLKRPSPTSINSQQPKPKKLFLDDPSPNYPLLRRSISDPPPAPSPPPPPDTVPQSASGVSPNQAASRSPANPDSATPCSAKGSTAAADCTAAQLPPRPPALRRSISDPTPSPAKSLSRTSSSTNEFDKTNDNSDKLTKIRNCWKQMNTWLEEFMGVEQSDDQTESHVEEEEQEQEEEDNGGGIATTTYQDNPKDINDTKRSETELEESLSVERDGKCLNIQFKCHCGKGYHFLLADGSCFYKLM